MGEEVVKTNSNRICWIDWAKCIGIYLVVLGHMEILTGKQFIYMFHMPLFFMLSGYLYKKQKFQIEIKKSFHSLIIPYFAFNLLLLVIGLFLGFYDKDIILNILCGNQELLPGRFYRPLWFLVSLFVIRVVSSLIPRKMYGLFAAFVILCVYITLRYNMLQGGRMCQIFFNFRLL